MAISEYYTPTHIYFGKEAEDKTGDVMKSLGYKKVLIHYGHGSVIKNGLLTKIERDLSNYNIGYIELGGVVPNPRIALAREGVRIGREKNVDLVLAIGG